MEVSRPGRHVFFNEEDELRSGWRILIFLLVLFFLSLAALNLLAIAGALFPGLGDLLTGTTTERSAASFVYVNALNRTTLLIACLAASWACARKLEGRSLGSIGFKSHARWWRDVLLGLALGATTLGCAVALVLAAGAADFQPQAGNSVTFAANLGLLLLLFAPAAAWEELLMRGFAFQALLHNLGPRAAIVITSLTFALLHLPNPNSSWLAPINTFVAGVWLGLAYVVTRSLWLATSLHVAWNVTTVFVFGLPVSGIDTLAGLGLLTGQLGDPSWFSGGSYGPEGGLAASVGLAASTLILWKTRLFQVSDEMTAATAHGSVRRTSEYAVRTS